MKSGQSAMFNYGPTPAVLAASLVFAVVLVSACARDQRDAPVQESGAAATLPGGAPDSAVIQTSTIIYVHATEAEIEQLKRSMPEDEFYITADDMMFYRATAVALLEKSTLPFTQLEGHRPLTFRVAGAPRKYDFADVETLDFIIVYTQDREPRVVAPIDVHTITGDTASANHDADQ